MNTCFSMQFNQYKVREGLVSSDQLYLYLMSCLCKSYFVIAEIISPSRFWPHYKPIINIYTIYISTCVIALDFNLIIVILLLQLESIFIVLATTENTQLSSTHINLSLKDCYLLQGHQTVHSGQGSGGVPSALLRVVRLGRTAADSRCGGCQRPPPRRRLPQPPQAQVRREEVLVLR